MSKNSSKINKDLLIKKTEKELKDIDKEIKVVQKLLREEVKKAKDEGKSTPNLNGYLTMSKSNGLIQHPLIKHLDILRKQKATYIRTLVSLQKEPNYNDDTEPDLNDFAENIGVDK